MQPLRVTRAGLIGSAIVLLVAATCVRLGIWQLHRLAERKAHNRVVAARMTESPLVIHRASADTAGLGYRHATATGRYDNARSMVWAGHSFQGEPGVYLLTPLLLPGGGALVVNRGWLPSPDAATVDIRSYVVDGDVSLEGILAPIPSADAAEDSLPRTTWYHLDAAALARSLPYPIDPLMLQVTPGNGPPRLPRALPPPALDEGPHLSYAIQWFSFATIGIVGWIVLLLRREGSATAGPDDRSPDRVAG